MKKIICAVSLLLCAICPAATCTWQGDSSDWRWWFGEGMWDVVPTSEDDAILGAGTTGVHSFIELKNGDDVSVKNLHLSSTEAANVHLKIPYGARLSVLNAIYPTKQGIKNVTNTIEVAGGDLSVKSLIGSGAATSLGIVKVTENGTFNISADTSITTVGWLGRSEIILDGGTFNFTSSTAKLILGTSASGYGALHASNNSKVDVSAQIILGANNKGARGDIVLDNASNMTISKGLSLGNYSTSSLILTNSILHIKGEGNSPLAIATISDGDTTLDKLSYTGIVEIVGNESILSNDYSLTIVNNAKIGLHGGKMILSRKTSESENVFSLGNLQKSPRNSLQLFDMTGGEFFITNASNNVYSRLNLASAGKPHFRQSGGYVHAAGLAFNGSGDDEPLYEISGGKLELYVKELTYGITGNDTQSNKQGIFSIVGGSPEILTPRIGNYYKSYQPLFDYVICTNGIAPLTLTERGSVSSLDWVNGFFNIRPQGGLQIIDFDSVKLIDGTKANRKFSLNSPGINTLLPSSELWIAPESLSVISDLSVMLNPNAEIAFGASLPSGISRGFIKLPKVKGNWEMARILLQLDVQEGETLAEIAEEFTKSGYASKIVSGNDEHNISVDIPLHLLSPGSSDEKLLFDFNVYSSGTDFAANAPRVRAFVRRANFETSNSGLMVIIR